MVKHFNKLNGKIFTVENNTALLTEDREGKPLYEQDIRTYKVIETNKKFVVYELDRCYKAKRKNTILKDDGLLPLVE